MRWIGHPERMTYGVLYIDEGNFLNWYDRLEDAERAVLDVARRDRAESAKVGFLAFADDGQPVGDFVSGADLLANGTAAA